MKFLNGGGTLHFDKVGMKMRVDEIIRELYCYKKKVNQVPSMVDGRIASAVREAYRKIGSIRKALFIAGIIPDARSRKYPQMTFILTGRGYDLDEQSKKRLKKIYPRSPHVKERIV